MLYEYSETYKVAMGTKTAIENVKISTKTVEIVGYSIFLISYLKKNTKFVLKI